LLIDSPWSGDRGSTAVVATGVFPWGEGSTIPRTARALAIYGVGMIFFRVNTPVDSAAVRLGFELNKGNPLLRFLGVSRRGNAVNLPGSGVCSVFFLTPQMLSKSLGKRGVRCGGGPRKLGISGLGIMLRMNYYNAFLASSSRTECSRKAVEACLRMPDTAHGAKQVPGPDWIRLPASP